jgi:hypothetical protein
MLALPATSASQLDRSAITGAASSAARVEVRRDDLGEGVELGTGALGIAHQRFIEHDAQVTCPLSHLLERTAAVAALHTVVCVTCSCTAGDAAACAASARCSLEPI